MFLSQMLYEKKEKRRRSLESKEKSIVAHLLQARLAISLGNSIA
jgi:hypothetical protein